MRGQQLAAFLTFSTFLISIVCNGEIVQMKVVDDISSYGYSHFGPDSSTNKLVAKVKPSNFSGPDHLKRLMGKCYTLKLNEYKYKFCPFDNVTQHEQTYRWNPYSGILGIWKEWKIVNNTFKSMIMANGDNCDSTSRQVEVVLECGTRNNLTSVTEPMTCSYLMIFETPLVCTEDAVSVYPRISEDLREAWDALEQEFHDGDITVKGYNIKLREILWKAGLVQDLSQTEGKDSFKPFESLNVCNAEYQKLLEEIEKLKKEKQ